MQEILYTQIITGSAIHRVWRDTPRGRIERIEAIIVVDGKRKHKSFNTQEEAHEWLQSNFTAGPTISTGQKMKAGKK